MVTKITPKSHYSRQLLQGFAKSGLLNNKVSLLIYASKSEMITDISYGKAVWTSTLYPFQIFKELLKDRPNILHIQHEFNMFGPFYATSIFHLLIVLAKLVKARVVTTVHAVVPLKMITKEFAKDFMDIYIPIIIIKMLFRIFYRLTYMLSDAIIVHNNYLKEIYIRDYLHNCSKDMRTKLYVIPHGISTSKDIENRYLDYWKKRLDSKRIILYFGYICPRKRIGCLIKAFKYFSKQHPNFILVIAGGIPTRYIKYFNNIKEMIHRLGIKDKVLITGFITEEDIDALFKLAEVVIFPYKYQISSSGPLTFAIKHKKPIIATKGKIFEEEINNAALIVNADPYEIAKAIERILNDPLLKLSLQKAMKKIYLARKWERIAQRVYSLYLNILNETGKATRK